MPVDFATRRSRRLSALNRRLHVVQATRLQTNRRLDADQLPTTSVSARSSKILVVNGDSVLASQVMVQLKQLGSSVIPLFVPSLKAAQLMLRRSSFDLIIGSAMLPDGPLTGLEQDLQKVKNPPPVIVVDTIEEAAEVPLDQEYRFAKLRHIKRSLYQHDIEISQSLLTHDRYIDSVLHEVSTDLRDKLNNPLQEIVAMVYVARNAPSETALVHSALQAIERAAQEMNGAVHSVIGDYTIRL
jgi:hypothetical protein